MYVDDKQILSVNILVIYKTYVKNYDVYLF